MTNEDLEEWRANPVTLRILSLLERRAAMLKQRECERYLQTLEANPLEALRAQAYREVWEDLSQSEADDIEAVEEAINEYERHEAYQPERPDQAG